MLENTRFYTMRLLDEGGAPKKIEFVNKNYKINRRTEELLCPDDLREGMVVLMDNPEFRVDLTGVEDLNHLSDIDRLRALQYNRWATISATKDWGDGGRYRSFLATYEDGTQIHRNARNSSWWIVKYDSIPKSMWDVWSLVGKSSPGKIYGTDPRYVQVLELVSEAMVKQDAATYHGVSSSVKDLNKDIAKRIMEVFE